MEDRHKVGLGLGLSDEPATASDIEGGTLNVKAYLDGFTAFIQGCATPLTAAIQGDWGTGKTSALNYIESKLEKEPNAIILDFNTWQYSQFNLGDQLAFSLLQSVFEQLYEMEKDEHSTIGKKLKGTLKVAGACFQPLLKVAVTTLGVGDQVEALQDSAKKVREEVKRQQEGPVQDASFASQLFDLREQFGEYIKGLTEKDGQCDKRIYILIDDLDRLTPERAVEVMEALKIFLNVPNCVFVLAIDFNVVLRGVRAKYGDDFDKDKARAFFDKIIQIPFNLPVGAYDLDSYVEPYLQESDTQYKNQYVGLLQESVGNNPRSIKRIFNTFSLMRAIQDVRAGNSNASFDYPVDTFAMLCFQNGYPEVFEDMLEQSGSTSDPGKYLNDLLEDLEQGDDDAEKTWNFEWRLPKNRLASLTAMLGIMDKLFGSDGDEKRGDRLREALVNAAITSVRSTADTDRNLTNTKHFTQGAFMQEITNNPEFTQETKDLVTAFINRLNQDGINIDVSYDEKYKRGNCGVVADESTNVNPDYLGSKVITINIQKNAIRVLFSARPRNIAVAKVEELRQDFEKIGFPQESPRGCPRTGVTGNGGTVSVNGIQNQEGARKVADLIAREITKTQ